VKNKFALANYAHAKIASRKKKDIK